MSFLEREIRRGISRGIGRAVGDAIGKAIQPTATNIANQAAQSIDQATNNGQPASNGYSGGSLEGAMSNLERSMQGYATKAAANMKVCPNCEKATTADKKFCPECGTALPEQTLAQGAVCTSCGKQNNLGTKFCQDCGTKLPIALQEEQIAANKAAAVMAQWDQLLPMFPKWNCGGVSFHIEDYGENNFMFSADFKGNSYAARQAVEQYRQFLMQNGFQMAGQYPSMNHLYRMVNNVCYHVDTEHCFDGDSDTACIGFNNSEPYGGFYYVKPEPKKKTSLFDLFG